MQEIEYTHKPVKGMDSYSVINVMSYISPLLPSGLQDTLPPTAEQDRYITNVLLDRFRLFGYEQVSPPLMEFEESLLSGKGVAHTHNSFRVMDTTSNRMMGIRPDITPQIERIARSLLAATDAPNVARLSYAGQVLRVSPSGLSPKRQLRQAGIEMIGNKEGISAIEILRAAIESLHCLGLKELVISLSYAGLFDILFAGCLAESKAMIQEAIHHKDSGSLPETMPYKEAVISLLAGKMRVKDLPPQVETALSEMETLQHTLQQDFSDIAILPDPLDTVGFDYHQGICFTVLEATTRQEIGRGGCYTLNEGDAGCGITLYVDRLLETPYSAAAQPQVQDVSRETSYQEAKQWRDKGIITLTNWQA